MKPKLKKKYQKKKKHNNQSQPLNGREREVDRRVGKGLMEWTRVYLKRSVEERQENG